MFQCQTVSSDRAGMTTESALMNHLFCFFIWRNWSFSSMHTILWGQAKYEHKMKRQASGPNKLGQNIRRRSILWGWGQFMVFCFWSSIFIYRMYVSKAFTKPDKKNKQPVALQHVQPISKLFQEDWSCWLCLPGPPARFREIVSMNDSFTTVKISFCWVIAIITVALSILRASYKALSHELENIRLPEQQLKSQGELYESGWSGVLSEYKCQDYVELQCWDRCKEGN